MDIVTQTIIAVAKKFHELEVTPEDITNGKTFDDYGIDSIDQIEFMLNLEEAEELGGIELPDVDNAEIENMAQLHKYITNNLPESLK